jgi:drug/metabolite transporter (DMT)-like permease
VSEAKAPPIAESAAAVSTAAQSSAAGRHLIGVALAVGGVMCFSLRPILIKLAYRYAADPVTLLALRMAFALPFFVLALAWFGRGEALAPISRRDGAAIIALGFVGYYLASYLDFLGLQYISAGLGRLVLFLYPTVVVLLSLVFLRKPIAGREIVALAISYAGLALALASTQGGATSNLPLGVTLVFASGIMYAIYLVGGTQILVRIGALRFSAYATFVASFFCILQFVLLRPLAALDLPLRVYGLCAIIGLACTVLPIFMTSEALRRIGASKVAMIGALGPISSIFWGYLGLDEAITVLQLCGAALVIGGVMLVTLKPRRARR